MKGKIIIIIVIIFIVYSSIYLFIYEPKYSGSISSENKIKIFAHRGLGNYAPDNSLVGAKMAMFNNFDGVDVDAQLSKDGQIVIFHDLSLDRLTGYTGKVRDLTLFELLSLDLSEKYKSINENKFEKSYIETFDKFVKEIAATGTLMVELKVTGVLDTGIEKEAIRIIGQYDAWDRVYLSSFNPVVLYRLKQIDKRVKTVFIFMDTNWNRDLISEIKSEDFVNLPWYLRNEYTRKMIRKIIKPDALSINNEVDEKVIDELLNKGYPIFLWTINDEERMEWAKSKKPLGIISDEPFKLREVLGN